MFVIKKKMWLPRVYVSSLETHTQAHQNSKHQLLDLNNGINYLFEVALLKTA